MHAHIHIIIQIYTDTHTHTKIISYITSIYIYISYIHITFILHSYYIHITFILHLYYIHITFILHSYYIHITFILHSYYIHTTFILHSYYIYITFILHSYYIHITFILPYVTVKKIYKYDQADVVHLLHFPGTKWPSTPRCRRWMSWTVVGVRCAWSPTPRRPRGSWPPNATRCKG